jgi:hypothetical protein
MLTRLPGTMRLQPVCNEQAMHQAFLPKRLALPTRWLSNNTTPSVPVVMQ